MSGKNPKTKNIVLLTGRDSKWQWSIIAKINPNSTFKNKGHLTLSNQNSKSFSLLAGYLDGWEWQIATLISANETFLARGTINLSKWKNENSIRYYKSEKGKLTYRRNQQTVKAINRRRRAGARRRRLKFIPLNNPIDGIDCDAHHTDTEHVIYIPRVIHRNISHNLSTGKNLKLINSIAEGFR